MCAGALEPPPATSSHQQAAPPTTVTHKGGRRRAGGAAAGHLGFHTRDYTPVARGFNTSWGFLEGGEDHWGHQCGAGAAACHVHWRKPGATDNLDLWQQSSDDFPGRPLRWSHAVGPPLARHEPLAGCAAGLGATEQLRST